MGANQSHEDINAAIRATADQLQTRPVPSSSTRQSSGKLQRLPRARKDAILRPQQRASRQRQLHGATVNPPYVDPTLGKAPPFGKRQLQDAPQISPLKRQRAGNPVVDATASRVDHRAGERRKADEQLRAEAVAAGLPQDGSNTTPDRDQQKARDDTRRRSAASEEEAIEQAQAGAETRSAVREAQLGKDTAVEATEEDRVQVLVSRPKSGRGRPPKSTKAPAELQPAAHTVSYTHLTLPTKRIV